MSSRPLPRERIRADNPFPPNYNPRLPVGRKLRIASDALVADRFRSLTVWLILVSCGVALLMELWLRVRFNGAGTYIFDWVIAAMLTASRIWWDRSGYERLADVAGTVGLVGLGSISCGAIAMLELRFHFPIEDSMLRAWDAALGFDGLVVVDFLARCGHWIFIIMAPAYNFAVPLFFASLVALSLLHERTEVWRAAFCFVGTLLTTCAVAAFVPAKGIGVWASPNLFDRLPVQAMRSFWPRFDDFYSGADPVLQLQAIDGVVSFPSFHAIVGFLVVAMWRKNVVTLAVAAVWLSVMLVATLPGGGHYLVDLIGGFIVWIAWFALSRRIEDNAITALPGNREAILSSR